MALTRNQVTLRTTDAIPANFITNTFYTRENIPAGIDEARAAFIAFYQGISMMYPLQIAQAGHEIKQYDMSDPLPRVPIREETFSFATAPAGDTLPSEVALCLSFQAPKASGVNQARRRGRVYLGPFNVGFSQGGRPSSQVVTAIQTAAVELLEASLMTADWDWVVYSPTTDPVGNAPQDAAIVVNGWIDNAWDTQRRRGIAPSARTLVQSA